MKLPIDAVFTAWGPQRFSNEIEVQRFIEDRVLPECGLTRVSSSLARQGRLWFMDTTAIDSESRPIIVEYKWDTVSGDTLLQLDGYKTWLLQHRREFDAAVAGRLQNPVAIDWQHLHIMTVGHRYHPSALRAGDKASRVTFLRYGRYEDKTAYLREVRRADLASGGVGEPAPREGKDHYLEHHKARTTPAAADAFDALRRCFINDMHLTEKIHGKNRVTYSGRGNSIEVRFTDVAVQVFFATKREVEDARVRRSNTDDQWTCGITTETDVVAVSELLRSIGLG